mgnify:CR=1 FL=1
MSLKFCSSTETPTDTSSAARSARSTSAPRFVLALLSTVLVLALCLPTTPVVAQSSEPVTLNFKDADIDTVIGAFGFLLGRTFIIDPRVRGKITVETPAPVSRGEAYKLLLSALRLQGFTIVSSGRLAKVVPEADAKLQSSAVNAGRQPAEGGDQIITQVFRLNYESATNLVPVLRPLIAPNNTISAYPNNNSLVITDYASNLKRISRILASLDSPTQSQIEVLQVEHGIASDLATMMNDLLDDTQRAGQGAQVDAGQRVVVVDPQVPTPGQLKRRTGLARTIGPHDHRQSVRMNRQIKLFNQALATSAEGQPGDLKRQHRLLARFRQTHDDQPQS